jgi:hypothetical protein
MRFSSRLRRCSRRWRRRTHSRSRSQSGSDLPNVAGSPVNLPISTAFACGLYRTVGGAYPAPPHPLRVGLVAQALLAGKERERPHQVLQVLRSCVPQKKGRSPTEQRTADEHTMSPDIHIPSAGSAITSHLFPSLHDAISSQACPCAVHSSRSCGDGRRSTQQCAGSTDGLAAAALACPQQRRVDGLLGRHSEIGVASLERRPEAWRSFS